MATPVFREGWKHAEAIYLPPVAWGTHWGWHPADTDLIFVRGASGDAHAEKPRPAPVTGHQQAEQPARQPAFVADTTPPYRFILQVDDNPPREVQLEQAHATAQSNGVPAPAVPELILRQIRRIIDHYLKAEAAEYAETSPREDRAGHIYLALRNVQRWLRMRGA